MLLFLSPSQVQNRGKHHRDVANAEDATADRYLWDLYLFLLYLLLLQMGRGGTQLWSSRHWLQLLPLRM